MCRCMYIIYNNIYNITRNVNNQHPKHLTHQHETLKHRITQQHEPESQQEYKPNTKHEQPFKHKHPKAQTNTN